MCMMQLCLFQLIWFHCAAEIYYLRHSQSKYPSTPTHHPLQVFVVALLGISFCHQWCACRKLDNFIFSTTNSRKIMAHKKYVSIGCFQDLRKGTGGCTPYSCIWPICGCAAGRGMVFLLSVLNSAYILCESVIILNRVLPA